MGRGNWTPLMWAVQNEYDRATAERRTKSLAGARTCRKEKAVTVEEIIKLAEEHSVVCDQRAKDMAAAGYRREALYNDGRSSGLRWLVEQIKKGEMK